MLPGFAAYRLYLTDIPRNSVPCGVFEQNLNGSLKEEDVAFLSQSAYADACCPGNPRDTSEEEIAELYKSLL